MQHLPWLLVTALVFLIGAWAGTKYPTVNVLAKVLP